MANLYSEMGNLETSTAVQTFQSAPVEKTYQERSQKKKSKRTSGCAEIKKNNKHMPYKGTTKFDPAVHCRIEEYLELHQDAYRKGEWSKEQIVVRLPTIEGYALFIGVHRSTLYDWEDEHEDISDTLEILRHEQKTRVMNMGLSGEYNSTIAKLILSANHDMRDKSDMTSKGKPIENTITLKKFDEPDSEL